MIAERREKLRQLEVGVYEETAPLKTLAIWGEPGCETVLGQLLPEDVSLFFKRFNVLAARDEFFKMEKLIEQQGVDVVRMKDSFADSLKDVVLPGLPNSINSMSDSMFQRGLEFWDRYHVGDLQVLQLIPMILEKDAQKYGEETAIKLNFILSLSHGLPMADIFYGRDQSNVLGKSVVISNMRWPVRIPEAPVLKTAYDYLGYDSKVATIERVDEMIGSVEGGDGIMFDNTCFIGIGIRTSRHAVAEIAKKIGPDLESKGMNIIAVVSPYLEGLKPKTPGEEMTAMHLDTFWMPIKEKTVLACMEEVEKRNAELVVWKNGKVDFINLGRFDKYMNQRGIGVVDICKEEQKNYSTNFLHIGHGKVIVPLSENKRVSEELQKQGLEVIPADICELIGGYGAVHCMTASIQRG